MKLTHERLGILKEQARKNIPASFLAAGVLDLIADLEEATSARGNGVLVPAQKLEEMQVEIRELRQKLSDTQNALLAARNSKEHYQEQWSEVCNENQILRNQRAEAQARIEAARKVTVLGSSFIEREACTILTGQDTSALDTAIAEVVEPYRKDAERYRWLTNDHGSPDTRKACHDISARIPVMSYSAASQAIDAAIAAKGKKP